MKRLVSLFLIPLLCSLPEVALGQRATFWAQNVTSSAFASVNGLSFIITVSAPRPDEGLVLELPPQAKPITAAAGRTAQLNRRMCLTSTVARFQESRRHGIVKSRPVQRPTRPASAS